VARSYILLAAQIFRSMSRHLSDLDELGVLVDGLNRTLLVHGDDINIVSQVLIGMDLSFLSLLSLQKKHITYSTHGCQHTISKAFHIRWWIWSIHSALRSGSSDRNGTENRTGL
jgi:hypothetical protein